MQSQLLKTSLSLFLFLCFTQDLLSQKEYLAISHFTEEAGLVTNGVNEKQSIIQDAQGFIWMGTENGLLRYDGYRFVKYIHEPNNLNSISSNYIKELLPDNDGNIWIGTDKGIDMFIPEVDSFRHFSLNRGVAGNGVEDIYLDTKNALWVVTEDDVYQKPYKDNAFASQRTKMIGVAEIHQSAIFEMVEIDKGTKFWFASRKNCLFEYNLLEGTTRQIDVPAEVCLDRSVQKITKLFKGSGGDIAIGTDQGMVIYSSKFNQFNLQDESAGYKVNDIVQSRDGVYHIATDKGLLFYNQTTGDLNQFAPEVSEPYSSSRDEIQVLFLDENENLWIGTRGHGIDKLSKKTKGFQYYNTIPSANQVALGEITCLQKWDGESYLLGSAEGLFIYDITQQTYRPLETQGKELAKAHITDILEDIFGQFWVSTRDQGLYTLSAEGVVISHIGATDFPDYAPCISETWSLAQDKYGNIWAGTLSGVFVVEASGKRIEKCYSPGKDDQQLNGEIVRTIYTDSRDRIWMGTTDGLSVWSDATKSFRHYSLPDYVNSRWIGNKNEIGSISENTPNSLWIKTLSGILEFNPQTQEFNALAFPDGLQASLVHSLVTDLSGNLWISSMSGIWKYEKKTNTFSQYNVSDGINSTNFNSRSFLENDGTIVFCGKQGFLRFHPSTIRKNTYVPPVRITEFSLFNEPLLAGSKNSPLDQPINFTKNIRLRHSQNGIGFKFSALSFTSSEDNEYAFKLEGFDQEWNYVGTRNEAVYTNLDPGHYAFRVRASNNDGVWNEEGTMIQIHIMRPWWNTPLAHILFIAMALGMVYVIYRFQLHRIELKHNLEMEHQEAERLKELDVTKSELYANITHEFRTPLTLISGMASEIGEDPENWVDTGVEVIKRNSASLLNLVNQMLDLSKLESGTLPLYNIQSDIISFSRYIHQSFQSYAVQKKIEIHFLAGQKEIMMDYDPDKYLQIISNLISNALKFTPEGGNIYISLNEITRKNAQLLEVKVKDTGKGIGPEVQQIFERYFTGDFHHHKSAQGTGIGLALTRDLVHLMGGSIKVKSIIEEGAEFSFVLPITKQAPLDREGFDSEEIKQNTLAFTLPLPSSGLDFIEVEEDLASSRPSLLVIEDNRDVANYIVTCVKKNFRVHTAFDGVSGFNKAVEVVPDIILLDLMLPDTSGNSLRKRLQQDQRTSHIPVIVLTASGDQQTKIEMLRTGIDDYLTKPFHKEELNERLIHALELRKELQERFSSEDGVKLSKAESKGEDAFMAQLKMVIENHLDDADFGIIHLCREMNLSRTQLHNKIKALTGKSTSIFVRYVRLQKARKLLNHSEHNVSQIAYDVGFKDPNYFTRCFTEEFGFPPSKVLK